MTNSGKIEAVIFDWAGTTVDHGSLAPVRVLRRVFESHGVPISEEEARRDMGLPKQDHIQRIISSPAVSERWLVRTGKRPEAKDVAALFNHFVSLQLECLVQDSPLIEGVAETVARISQRRVKIGSTTGYTREMMDLLAPAAAESGYRPDCVATPNDVGGGRPHPWMIFRNAILLRIDHLSTIVKIGDTITDIEEGRNAGVWTIGVARTGNMIGMTSSDLAALPHEEQHRRLERARSLLLSVGAHAVVDSVAECEPKLEQIEEWIREGRSPAHPVGARKD